MNEGRGGNRKERRLPSKKMTTSSERADEMRERERDMCQKICNSLQYLDEFSTPFRPVEPMRRPENPEDETFGGFFFSAVIFPKFPSKIQLAPVAYIRRTLLRGGRTPDPSSRNCAQRKRPNFSTLSVRPPGICYTVSHTRPCPIRRKDSKRRDTLCH